MRTKILTTRLTKLLALIVVAGLLLSVRQPEVSGVVFAADPAVGNLSFNDSALQTDGQLTGRILSNGQFVYGPNVGDSTWRFICRGMPPTWRVWRKACMDGRIISVSTRKCT